MSSYLIKTGNHYASGLHFGVHFGITEQKYRVKFSKECLYTPLDWENDWNKLCGWSYGLHHNNSIRVCWRPYRKVTDNNDTTQTTSTNQIELCIYVYEDEVRKTSEQTLVVDMEDDIAISLEYSTRFSTVTLKSDALYPLRVQMNYSTKPSWGYFLYPYFGGNAPSPHNMNIELERL